MDNSQDVRVNKQQSDYKDKKNPSIATNRFSSDDQKKDVSDVVFSKLVDYFFNKVVFINLAYSDLGGGGTTSTTDYGKLSRIIDTSQGLLMSPGKESRLRCQFYIKNPSVIDGYLLSPCVFDEQTLPTITSMSIFRSYVGLRFIRGVTYVVVKEAGQLEALYPINFTLEMSDATFTKTYALEIRHQVNYTEIYINNQYYGSYSTDLIGSGNTNETFFPFFTPAKTTDTVTSAGSFVVGQNYQIVTVGSTNFTAIGASSNTVGVNFTATGSGSGTGTATRAVNIVSENIQFIQSK